MSRLRVRTIIIVNMPATATLLNLTQIYETTPSNTVTMQTYCPEQFLLLLPSSTPLPLLLLLPMLTLLWLNNKQLLRVGSCPHERI